MNALFRRNRLETVRAYVDDVLSHMTDTAEQKSAYVHLYGVAQACAMIAEKRCENIELAIIAGMLHDLYAYKTMQHDDHAHQGAALAKEILHKLGMFSQAETEMVCEAIYHHSDKAMSHAPFTEILIDADVLQHYLYNPYIPVSESEQTRIQNLKKEFGLNPTP